MDNLSNFISSPSDTMTVLSQRVNALTTDYGGFLSVDWIFTW